MPADALALALGAAFLHALWNLLLARERDPEAATAVAICASVVVFAPVAVVVWDVDSRVWPFIAATSLLQLVYFSLFTVVLGVLGFNNAARRLGPLNAMLMLNVVPVLVFGIEASLGRSFAPIELVGAAVVIGALVANNLYLRGVSKK